MKKAKDLGEKNAWMHKPAARGYAGHCGAALRLKRAQREAGAPHDYHKIAAGIGADRTATGRQRVTSSSPSPPQLRSRDHRLGQRPHLLATLPSR
jgi:hypothetical protein